MTDGAFSDDGAFHALETWDADAVMKLFRERLLARLVVRQHEKATVARRFVGLAARYEDG